jgi:type II secretory pathway predicted ATPase ExeA/tetratricopeptide (TPR) repeat protein
MYKKFYGFQKMPFPLSEETTPNTIYLSKNYTEMLSVLITSLEEKIMLSIVFGREGAGKSTFCYYMCHFFDQVFATNSDSTHHDSAEAFFHDVLTSFNQKIAHQGQDKILQQLEVFLTSQSNEHKGHPTLLILDNADSLSPDAIEGIELLLRLNTEEKQLLQIVLVGQPTLLELLKNPGLHTFLQNTSPMYTLAPLTEEETQGYIHHKIKLAGVKSNTLFNEKACSMIYDYSDGVPSVINKICDKSLLHGSELQKKEISTDSILEIIGDTKLNNSRRMLSLALILTTGFVGIGLAFFLANKFISQPEVLPETLPSKVVSEMQPDILPEVLPKELPAKPPQEILIKSASPKPIADPQPEKKEIIVKKEIVSKKTQKKVSPIETRLAIAKKQMSRYKLTAPKRDNAYETYQAILKISPNEKRALKGLEGIANYYAKHAKKHYLRGNIHKANFLISKGLKVSPSHRGLIQLESQTKIANLPVKKGKNKIQALFEKAGQQNKALQYTQPFQNSAYKTYQEILALDSDNSQAKYGILRIVSRLSSKVEKALANKDYSTALKISAKILALPSEGVSTYGHKKVMSKAINTKNIVIKALLKQGYLQQKRQQSTYLHGSEAFKSYMRVLQISPKNKEAKQGVNSLRIQFQNLARAALSAQKTNQALNLTQEGLRIFPNNSLLLATHQKILKESKRLSKNKGN